MQHARHLLCIAVFFASGGGLRPASAADTSPAPLSPDLVAYARKVEALERDVAAASQLR